ncbi:UbiA family prenyltransferase [candidate division WOR-3 bacterium]|nr:UbiA family prenyltransferase [candidate division WOR-3 bacterium]
MRKDWLGKIISLMENQNLNWFSIIFTFFTVIILRNFLEGIFEEAHSITLLEDVYTSVLINFIHFLFFYLSFFLSLSIFLSCITREKFKNVLRVIAVFSPIILIPPIVDVIISKGLGLNLSYPKEAFDFLKLLLTGPFFRGRIEGITPGMRIEVIIATILVFLYVYGKRKKILKSILSIIIFHLLVVIIGSLPLIASIIASKGFGAFYTTGSLLTSDTQKFGILYLLLFTILLLIVGFVFYPSFTKKISKSIRFMRSLNYTGAVLFGFLIGYSMLREYVSFLFKNPWDYLALLSLPIAIFFAFSGAVIINDIYDIRSDTISRQRNPLITNKVKKKHYLFTGLLFFFLALSYALNTSYTAFFIVLILILVSFVYSSPPFRLKRLPIISTFILAFLTLLCLILGFSLFAGSRSFLSFPHKLQLLFLVSLTFGFTPKDLVDVDGDRLSNVYTIPVIFGKKSGKLITYILLCISFLFVPFILHSNFILFLSILFVILTGFEFLLKKINENIFLITYYLFSFIIILFLFFNPYLIKQKDITDIGFFHRGKEYYNEKKYEKALEYLSKITENRKAETFLIAGISAFKVNDIQSAIKYLSTAIDINPHKADIYSYLTNVYVKSGNIDKAFLVNSTALKQWIDLKRFLSERGIILFHSDDIQKAEIYLRTAYMLGYRESSILFYLARIKIKKGDTQEAEVLLKKILSKNKSNIKALAELGKLKMELKEFTEAIKIYKRALATVKNEPLFYNNIGVSYQRLGEMEKARFFYKIALKIKPNYLPAKRNLANLPEKTNTSH